MASYLLKTEPSTYSWSDLVREQRTVWDGIRNAAALIAIRQMKAGDEAIIYHSGDQRAIVGIAKIVKGAYHDPKHDDPKLAVVDVVPVKELKEPIPLARIKAEPGLAQFPLVRISRLSTMPVNAKERKLLEKLGVR
ncbi:MAG TPA: EVE domain-containing protein [Gemmatimonadales bacterium]|nr:EVE domain-containing protein [Gemmatimonadales bacterium]